MRLDEVDSPTKQVAIKQIVQEKSRASAQSARARLRQGFKRAARIGIVESDLTVPTQVLGRSPRHRPSAPTDDTVTKARHTLRTLGAGTYGKLFSGELSPENKDK